MTTKMKDKPPAKAKAAKKPLTDATVRSLKTPGAHADGTVRGLFLVVTAAGSKSWRLRYWIDKKEYVYTLGVYSLETPPPARFLSLADARATAATAKTMVTHGQHPKDAEKAVAAARKAKDALTFSAVAQEFVDWSKANAQVNEGRGWSASTDKGHRYALKQINVLMGPVPVANVDVDHIKAVLIHYQGKRTAQKFALSVIKRVLGFAKVSRYVSENIAVGCESLLPKRRKKGERSDRSHPAIVTVDGMTEYLHRLYAHNGQTSSFYGLKLLTMLPCRPSELAHMRWSEVDLEGGRWTYIMPKVNSQHIIGLPRQAVALLRELLARRQGHAEYVLPGRRRGDSHINPESFRLALIEQLGYAVGSVSPHGFRASWRTLGQRPLRIDVDILEMSMGHETKDPNGRAYNRNDLLDERFEEAQRYADWLDELRSTPAQNNDRMNGIE